jgi:hypothetical protein
MKLPQLTLRDLFWLVLVCAVACGWWISARATREAKIESERAWEITEAIKMRLEEIENRTGTGEGADYSGTITEVIPVD